MTDLSNYSLADLRELQKQVAEQIAARQASEKEKVRQQILELAGSVGLSVEEILNTKLAKQTRPATVRYQDPHDSNNKWTGRGRQPKWVKEHVESGKPLEALQV